nr:tetratricopeptide repeat-containing serine protease family protein [Desulfobaculum xiamenense]
MPRLIPLILLAATALLLALSHPCAADSPFFSDCAPNRTDDTRLRRSAQQGNAESQYILGVVLTVRAEEENRAGWRGQARMLYREASTWFRKAAEHGHPQAQFALGYLLSQGLGTNRDVAAALPWLRLAAEQRVPDAQYLLGMMSAHGEGMQRNTAQAVGMLADAGVAFATHGRTNLALECARAISAITPGHPSVKAITEMLRRGGWDGTRDDASLSTGTGWPVAEGFVVTNLHVVRGATSITLLLSDGTQLDAAIAHVDERNDLVLLAVDDPCALPPALPLAAKAPELGADVFTVGFPQAAILGSSPKLATGRISGMLGIQDDPRTYTISVPVSAGNSGGPLVNLSGEVVGVVQARINAEKVFMETGELPGEMNYALRADLVRALLARVPHGRTGLASTLRKTFGLGCPKINLPEPNTLAHHANTVQASVVMIVAR